ncbi:DUF4268 domain-containing protein [Psychroflexus lacisalsi]|jgi:uncharacterized protein with ParB-like and HNH nuclease domain|uniref:DUF4268 domain-containing protein n=1 Tax=Psychroflexus lacisalsi TaxID=503928 RepID=A0ABP3VN48_9FLAO|nr:DUF4268 domain-containing protein [Psychroflexus lacisalsi]MBZ9620136.1 DUF4268 domain-containing protein [Psychroflexus lacisalsi]
MIATQLPIVEFIEKRNVQFVIPVYQRNYDWSTNECHKLSNDIITVAREQSGSHFIGSIVFIHEGAYSTREVKELVIIDGQQRLTTINILYVALFRFAKETNQGHEAEKLYNMFLTNQYVQNESSKLKLKQTDTNSQAFKAIMNATEGEFDAYSNVIENFNYFKSKINEANFQTILDGLRKLIFVEISLERDKDDPQRIFESLNSTGLDLSQSDLIRNYILMDLPPRQQDKVYNQIWNPIEENAKDLIKQKSLVSEYIRDYLTLKKKKIPNKSKVYEEFKKMYQDKDEAYQQELENIKSYSVHYKKLVNPQTVKNDTIRKELNYISRLEINVAFPFLLQVFEDADNGIISDEILIKILKLIQSYTWRRFIVGLPTNALNKVFMTLYSEIDTEDYYESVVLALYKKRGSGKFPNDQEVRTALKDKDLYNIQTKNRNYMFELLENFNNKEHVDTSNPNISIEHIFPQNPNPDWSNQLNSEDFFMFKERYLNTIANLTLSGNNGALSNKSFSAKKVMNNNNDEQGYQFSRLWLNSYLTTLDEWSIKNYEERFELIYIRFLKIWEYPDIELPEEEKGTEINIFEAGNPTGKKLEYFIFEDTKYDESAVSMMYFEVVKTLFQKNPKLLIENQDIMKITKNEEDFRAPSEIANGYQIEFNIDSKSKFNYLKKLLTLYDLEDELVIKYSDNNPISFKANRHVVRHKYWERILDKIENTHLFENVNPTKDHWLSTGAGKAGVAYTMVITKSITRIELTLGSSSKERNKRYFKRLVNHKTEIENRFGGQLVWEELPNNKMSRIKIEINHVNLFNEDDWDEMDNFFIENLPKFEEAFKNYLGQLT